MPQQVHLLGQAESTLSVMVQYDAQLQPLLDLVSDALATVVEAGRQINVYGKWRPIPQAATVEERLRAEADLSKYGPTLKEVIAYYQRIQAELKN